MSSSLLDIPYLRAYWARQTGSEPVAAGDAAPDLDSTLLCGLQLNIRETLQFLHAQRPGFEAFERWIMERSAGALTPAALDRLRRALAGETVASEIGSLEGVEGLSDEDLAHWDEHGFVILRGAVSEDAAHAAEAAVYDHLGASADDPASWYGNPQGHSIWVDLLRHPAFVANRRSPRMVKAFAQLWGREDLWVTVDQGGLNPPERPGWLFPGPHTHWDTTIATPHPFGTQGILYLADVAEDQGAFTCVPGSHRTLDAWLARLPAGADPRAEALKLPLKPIAAHRGDMVIWHHLLPHGSSPNRATRPRVAQYINMQPTRWASNPVWL